MEVQDNYWNRGLKSQGLPCLYVVPMGLTTNLWGVSLFADEKGEAEENLGGLVMFGERQSRDLLLCAFHTARASCQATKAFSSREGETGSWAGLRASGVEAHHSAHQWLQTPTICKASFWAGWTRCLSLWGCGGIWSGRKRGRRERTLQLWSVYPDFKELGSPSRACPNCHLPPELSGTTCCPTTPCSACSDFLAPVLDLASVAFLPPAPWMVISPVPVVCLQVIFSTKFHICKSEALRKHAS